jgi:hypothetical protein
MMRFPLRLTLALTRTRLAQLLGRKRPLFRRLDLAKVLACNSGQALDQQTLRSILREPSRLLWIHGSEALDHSGAAQLVRALTRSGRTVFLESDGTALRGRIHEFQPVENLFLVVRFASADTVALPLEGLRAARLSGFYTVALFPLTPASGVSEIQTLNCSLAQLSIDGALVYATAESVRPLAIEVRSLVCDRRWRALSQLVEREFFLRRETQSDLPVLPPAENALADRTVEEGAAAS